MTQLAKSAIFIVMAALLQSLLFSNLTFGISLMPLAYISLIVLQPMQRSQLEMICIGFLLGVAVDAMEGCAGLHTIATLFVSYTRIYLLQLFIGKDMIGLGGIALPPRIRTMKLVRYCLAMVSLHAVIFFGFESMNWGLWQMTLTFCAMNIVATLLFLYLAVAFASIVNSRYSD